jgi:hypothetical protein
MAYTAGVALSGPAGARLRHCATVALVVRADGVSNPLLTARRVDGASMASKACSSAAFR